MDMMTTKVFKMVHPMAIPIEVQGCHIVNTQAVIEFLQTFPTLMCAQTSMLW